MKSLKNILLCRFKYRSTVQTYAYNWVRSRPALAFSKFTGSTMIITSKSPAFSRSCTKQTLLQQNAQFLKQAVFN